MLGIILQQTNYPIGDKLMILGNGFGRRAGLKQRLRALVQKIHSSQVVEDTFVNAQW